MRFLNLPRFSLYALFAFLSDWQLNEPTHCLFASFVTNHKCRGSEKEKKIIFFLKVLSILFDFIYSFFKPWTVPYKPMFDYLILKF